MNANTQLALIDAKQALSRSGAFSLAVQTRALNDAVKAGVVFG